MTREEGLRAVRALARLVVICGAKRHNMKIKLAPRVDEAEQRRGARPGNAISLETESYPGESGRSDPYRLLHALAILDRQQRGDR